MIRKLFSLSLLLLTVMMFSPTFSTLELAILFSAAFLSFLWGSMGYVFLALLGILLVYRSVPGVYGLLTLSLSIIYVESLHLARRKAPLGHYVVLFASVLLAIPLYYTALMTSTFLPSLSNTSIAAIFIVSVYVLLYVVIKH
ncbi:hypothetical protein [Thermococcus sp.]|uniref:hypothetical protein n=1 Tax=Thermococcus sp. TaxID=35749 RepID=UPI0025FDA270|nr:hypothetical protein [Thermococcus sp.]